MVEDEIPLFIHAGFGKFNFEISPLCIIMTSGTRQSGREVFWMECVTMFLLQLNRKKDHLYQM